MSPVQALNHFGLTNSLAVTIAVQDVLKICKEKTLLLDMHLILGHPNVLADALSCNYLMPGEWEIHPQDLTEIISLFPLLMETRWPLLTILFWKPSYFRFLT